MVSCQSAVAENQPVNKHRMNQELSDFAARLRDSIIAGFDGEHFDDLAVELFALQYQYNPVYRSLCAWRKMSPSRLGAVRAMTLSVAKDFLDKNIRCNCISPARVHTPFVDGYLKQNYPGREAEMLAELAKTQPVGRMARPEEVAGLAVYLSSDLASFLTGADVPFDGGVLNLRG